MESRLEWRLEGLGRLLSDLFTRAEQISHEHVTTALHDAGSPAADDSHRRASLEGNTVRASRTKDERKFRLWGHGGCHSSTQRTTRSEACLRSKMPGCRRGRDDLQRSHQGHPKRSAGETRKMVTMRAECLATTEADFSGRSSAAKKKRRDTSTSFQRRKRQARAP